MALDGDSRGGGRARRSRREEAGEARRARRARRGRRDEADGTRQARRGDLWEASIDSLFINLMSPGYIDRGRAGELVARLLCVLARDRVLHGTTKIASTRLKYAQPFGVIDFLQSLFRQTKELLDLPAKVIPKKRGLSEYVRPIISQ